VGQIGVENFNALKWLELAGYPQSASGLGRFGGWIADLQFDVIETGDDGFPLP